jgi:hypothetical protein
VRCGNVLEVQILDMQAHGSSSTYADSCTSSLFSQTWFCPTCGLELCDSCVMVSSSSQLIIYALNHWSTVEQLRKSSVLI